MRWTDRYNQGDLLGGDPDETKTGKGPKLVLILGLSVALAAMVVIAGGVLLFRRERRKTVQDYDGILYGKTTDIRQDPSLGSSSHSGITHLNGNGLIETGTSLRAAHSSAASKTQPWGQTGFLTPTIANINSGNHHSRGDDSWQDNVSIRTVTSGKYIQETDDESPSRKSRRRQKHQKHNRPNSQLGHKIEMSSRGPQGNGVGDITTLLNRQGDPINISPASPFHNIAPYAAASAPPKSNDR
jgi:hypothetical protein